MALRAVPEHPKFAHLKALLGQPKGATLGWLESIWHFAGRFTPQGNIGKYDDQAIESWVEWSGNPGALIAALVKSRWLDVNEDHRLLVHDWPQHADKATKAALKRAKLDFYIPGVVTPLEQLEHIETETDAARTPPVPVPVPVPDPVPVQKASAPDKPDAQPKREPCLDCDDGKCTMNCGPCIPKPDAAARVESVLRLVPQKLKPHVSTPDPRFTPFREEIQHYWALTNPGLDMPWDASEAKRLNEWLKACPTITLEQLQTMLANRSRSTVVQSHRPRLWIQSLTDYANGPVDSYGKPVIATRPQAGVSILDEDPTMRLVWKTDGDYRIEKGFTAEQYADLALEIDAKEKRPLHPDREDLIAKFQNVIDVRARINRVAHPEALSC